MSRPNNVIPYDAFNVLRFLKNSIKFYESQEKKHLYEDSLKREKNLFKEILHEALDKGKK